MGRKRNTEADFWTLVDESGECWEWQGRLAPTGYGVYSMSGVHGSAHRIAYMLTHGAMPEKGIQVMHICDNRRCVRPDHLVLGTAADNAADKMRKGRWSTGPNAPNLTPPMQTITPQRIKRVRERLGLTQEVFAQRLLVSVQTVSRWERGWVKPSRLAVQQLGKMEREAE